MSQQKHGDRPTAEAFESICNKLYTKHVEEHGLYGKYEKEIGVKKMSINRKS